MILRIILILAFASSVFGADLPKGGSVTLIRDEPLYFKGSVYRQGKKGETFTVYSQDAGSKRVFFITKDAQGQMIALNVTDDALVLGNGNSGGDAPAVQQDRKPAFENIYFGDSRAMVAQKLKSSTKLSRDPDMIISDDELTGYHLDINDQHMAAIFEFLDDHLYQISFGFGSDYRFYSLVESAWQSLRDVGIAKFGEPTSSHGKPDFLELKEGYIVWSDDWAFNGRHVKLGMEKYDTGVNATLYLSDDGLTAKKEAMEQEKQKESVKAAAGGF